MIVVINRKKAKDWKDYIFFGLFLYKKTGGNSVSNLLLPKALQEILQEFTRNRIRVNDVNKAIRGGFYGREKVLLAKT